MSEDKKQPEFKFNVNDLAEKMGVQPASARIALRKSGIKKQGKSYGWNTKADLDAMAKTLKAAPAEKKPAAKPAAKKAAPKKVKAEATE